MMQIGAQFFTLREQCKTLGDFSEALKRVAEIGYRTVQISGVCPYEPEWLRDRLRENGLSCVITHTNQDRIADETEKVIAEHSVFGCDYIGVGSMPGQLRHPGDYESFVERFRPAGAFPCPCALRGAGRCASVHGFCRARAGLCPDGADHALCRAALPPAAEMVRRAGGGSRAHLCGRALCASCGAERGERGGCFP